MKEWGKDAGRQSVRGFLGVKGCNGDVKDNQYCFNHIVHKGNIDVSIERTIGAAENMSQILFMLTKT